MGLGSRYSQHSFAEVPSANIQRSSFNRSFTIKDTFNFDELVPIFVDEILPGDTMNCNVNTFGRLATQLVPIMDNMYIDYFFFFVPNRLVWNNWERFNGAQDNPDDSTDFLIPITASPNVAGGFAIGSIYDKFGLPTGVQATDLGVNALPFRAYNLIWNQWFRDENLQDSVPVPKTDGPDSLDTFKLLKRGKRHDYFTSALPWPQKGDPIELPIGVSAPVLRSPSANAWLTYNGGTNTIAGASSTSGKVGFMLNDATGQLKNDANVGGVTPVSLDPNGGLYADLAAATAATVNQFREAIMVQSLLELDARGGTRYTEILKAHFGVTSPDFRLQRAEFLGGGQSRINSHPVAQTANDGSTPLANLGAFATTSTNGGAVGFSKSFTEHGYIIGMACARADITYQQGLNRMWSRRTRFEFFWPKLQQLGEQAILTKELYFGTTPSENSKVFGYQERYGEYRYKPSEIHGQFRSTSATPLDMWHMAQEFSGYPQLNEEFIEQSTPIERAIAVEDEPDLLFDAYFEYRCARPMMTYAVPATLGRF